LYAFRAMAWQSGGEPVKGSMALAFYAGRDMGSGADLCFSGGCRPWDMDLYASAGMGMDYRGRSNASMSRAESAAQSQPLVTIEP